MEYRDLIPLDKKILDILPLNLVLTAWIGIIVWVVVSGLFLNLEKEFKICLTLKNFNTLFSIVCGNTNSQDNNSSLEIGEELHFVARLTCWTFILKVAVTDQTFGALWILQ